jgi:transcriptional regulator with XRE-family HTH domain
VKQKHRSLAAYYKGKPRGSQIALARKLGVSKAYISFLVAGDRQPSLGLALRIEAETGVPASSMVSEERVA